MSNVHVLETSGQSATLVYHFPIPATSNTVGVPWRTAYARYKGSVVAGVFTAPSSALPTGDGSGGSITSAEAAKIASGEIAEIVHTEKNRPSSNAQLDELWAKRLAQFQDEMADKLSFYGYSR